VEIVRCVSCDGYGWQDDEEDGETDCAWCGGVGYVYRDEVGVDRRIPASDFATVADTLEALETQRLREMGYSGGAKKPWEQAVRKQRGDHLTRLAGEVDNEAEDD
jgi:hypothetical protein